LKRVALNTHVAPSELHSQPPYAEPLPVQVEEGLVVVAVEELAAPPPPAATTIVGEERMVTETTAPKRYRSHRPGPARAATTW
jgi:hypothetical protein